MPPVCIGDYPPPMRRVETFLIVIAIAFYVWFLAHYGPGQVLGYVRLVGWGLGLTIALESLSRIANTLGWRVTIEDYPPRLGLIELFAARIGGEAIDYVTSLRLIPIAADLYWSIVSGFALAVALAGGFFFIQMKRPFSHLWRAAAKLDIGRINTDEIRASADEADTVLIDFYSRHRGRLVVSCLCYAVAWSLGPLEIFILLRMLHQPATLQVVLLVEAVGLLIERATFLIPAKLVSQEGGKALILGMLGYPPGIGFVVGFLRRIKEMVWVLLGLLSLMIHRTISQSHTDSDRRTIGASARSPDSAMKMQRVQGEQPL